MPKVLIDGALVDVPANALFADDGQTALNIPTGPVFTSEDLERVRSEEKDKLYGRIEENNKELTDLREQVGSLTAAEQRRQAQLQEEQARLEEERRRQEEEGLSAKELIARARDEWNSELTQREQDWNARFEEERQAREQSEALRQKEIEFGQLRDYTLAAVEANKDKIAPQLLGWITGNSQEEIDAAITRAIETTDQILAEVQQATGQQQVQQVVGPDGQVIAVQPGAQPVPPVQPGTRAVAGPGMIDPAGVGTQTLTQEQINDMPMSQYAELRKRLGIGGQGNNRGLFG